MTIRFVNAEQAEDKGLALIDAPLCGVGTPQKLVAL